MGLFSRFKKKDEEAAPAAGPAAAVETAPPSGSAGDTPFVAPGAWDMDVAALTAPVEPQGGDRPDVGPQDAAATAELPPGIVDVLKTVYDREIPVDIYELGLIYDIIVDAERKVLVKMTLTSPACPSAQQLPSEVRYKVKAVPGVANAWVDVVWEPPWDKDRMSEAAKLSLGFF
jgi:FeS assembly SUF system protein